MTSPTHRPDSFSIDPRLQRLRGLLAALERRFRLQEAARLIPWALGVALVLTIGLGLSMRLAGWPDLPVLGLAGAFILLASCACVFAYAFLRPRDTLATALQADLRLGLDERLSTAVEDASKSSSQSQRIAGGVARCPAGRCIALPRGRGACSRFACCAGQEAHSCRRARSRCFCWRHCSFRVR